MLFGQGGRRGPPRIVTKALRSDRNFLLTLTELEEKDKGRMSALKFHCVPYVATETFDLNRAFAMIVAHHESIPTRRAFLNRWWAAAGLGMAAACVLFASGCATHQPIPRVYLDRSHAAGLVIQKVPGAPVMMDSGQGGLIGAIITATSRANNMKEKLAGLDGGQVQATFAEAFTRLMAEHLALAESGGGLRIVVNIDTWGWFVPTIDFGIKVGDYECQLIGRVDVFDSQDKRVAYAHLRVAEPLGDKPGEDSARRAVTLVAEDFATAAEHALVHIPKGR
jgi:hypothetical protein